MTTGLPDFFKYNLWANLRLLDACAQLSDAQLDATTKGTFGSVRETLMHLFAAEEGYVRDITGTAPTPRLEELTTFAGFDELRRRAERSGKELITIAEQRDLSQMMVPDISKCDSVSHPLETLRQSSVGFTVACLCCLDKVREFFHNPDLAVSDLL